MTDNTSLIEPEALAWLKTHGFVVGAHALWRAALTHGSLSEAEDYQRLEFLGDRVLGLSIADWLFVHSKAAEGQLSQRLNALVSRAMCARIARDIGLGPIIRISAQAHSDGGRESENILGDVMEALLGAHYVEHGYASARDLIHTLWEVPLQGDAGAQKHPKSALQEWAAGNQRRPPEYVVIDRSGPDHAARFTVQVSIHNVGAAQAEASSKQAAEKAAARAFMEEFG
jgi:ribonuclease-3